MAIKYAGVTLLLEDVRGEIIDHANRYLATEDLRAFTCAPEIHQNNLPLPYPNYSTPLRPKINTLYWPTGASRWAVGYFLVNTAKLREIISKHPNGGPARLGLATEHNRGGAELSAGGAIAQGSIADEFLYSVAFSVNPPDDRGFLITPEMYWLPARPLTASSAHNVTGTAGKSETDLWILPLVDQRYFWQFKSLYSSKTTWKGIFDDIKTALVLTDTNTDTYGAAFGVPDERAFRTRPSPDGPYFNAAVLLDGLAVSLGLRVNTLPRRDTKFNLTIKLETSGEATATRDLFNQNTTTDGVLAGGMIHRTASEGEIPGTLRLVFPRYCNGIFTDGNAYTLDRLSKNYGGTNPNEQIHYLNVTAAADFTSGGGAPDNAANLGTMADAIATSFYGWLSTREDRTFFGIRPWIPTGYDDYVEWSFYRMPNGTFQAQTRVHGMPYNFLTSRWSSQLFGIKYYPDFIEGTLAGDLAALGTADMNVIGADGGGTVEVEDRYGWTLASGKKLGVMKKWKGGQCIWRPIVSEC